MCRLARLSDVELDEVEGLAGALDEFVGDVFGSLTRSGWQDRAGWYLRGLMLDGRRKSIQPMASRLEVVNDQALVTRDYAYFVENQLRRRLGLEGAPVIIDFKSRS